jgi:thiosulfate/3-mercaptopyruvate sulfurtransferase
MTLQYSGPVIEAETLLANLDQPRLRIIDTRPYHDYAQLHIPNASNIDVNTLRIRNSEPQTVQFAIRQMHDAIKRAGVRTGDFVVFYEDFSGASAARGVWMLDFLGIPNATMLNGGLAVWSRMDGPLTDESVSVEPGDVEISPNFALLAVANDLSGEPEPNVRIVDTRATGEYLSGTIPTSVHIDWMSNVERDGRFKSPEKLQALYDSAGIVKNDDRPVVTFCGSGYRAANTYVVLKPLGYPDVRNYAPSWGEWGASGKFPVERPSRG